MSNGNFYKNMESAIKQNGERGLIQLEHYYGVELSIYREIQSSTNVYGRVHGKNSGKEGEFVENFIGVVIGDDFFPSSNLSGSFVAGFLYTRHGNIKTGDTIKINSDDGKIRRYKIESKDNIGLTTEIFTRWKISSIGD